MIAAITVRSWTRLVEARADLIFSRGPLPRGGQVRRGGRRVVQQLVDKAIGTETKMGEEELSLHP